MKQSFRRGLHAHFRGNHLKPKPMIEIRQADGTSQLYWPTA
jgi:hypothetical protein